MRRNHPRGGLAATLAVLVLLACSPMETEEDRRVSYAKNVESCLCRSLEFETDSYSGLTYDRMIERNLGGIGR